MYIIDASWSLANPGPPLVIAQTSSKLFSPPIKDNRITVFLEEQDRGTVIFQNLSHAFPPSAISASLYSWGIAIIPDI